MKKIRYPLIKPFVPSQTKQRLAGILKSGWLTQGEWARKSEMFLSKFLRVKFSLLLNSATSGLICALKILKLPRNSKVIVPSFTFPATANAVVLNGLEPVFCDIDTDTFNLSPSKLSKLLTKNTRAVVVVHEFGLSADMNPILEIARKYNLYLIEDAACSLGAEYKGKRVGTFGQIGVFSFHPRKVITSGEGGALVTDNSNFAREVEYLRNHGERNRKFVGCGYNFRLSDIQAGVLYEQLKILKSIISRRIKLAENYNRLLKDSENRGLLRRPVCPHDYRHIFQSYVIFLDERISRDKVRMFLRRRGIETQFGTYCVPILDYYRKNFRTPYSNYRNAHLAYRQTLTLPLYEGLTFDDQEYITQSLKKVLRICVQ